MNVTCRSSKCYIFQCYPGMLSWGSSALFQSRAQSWLCTGKNQSSSTGLSLSCKHRDCRSRLSAVRQRSVATHHPKMVTPVMMCGEPRSNVVQASCGSGITQNVSGLSAMGEQESCVSGLSAMGEQESCVSG